LNLRNLSASGEARVGSFLTFIHAMSKQLDQMLKINEIFHSIQGESSYAGNPTVFVRTTGCNLRCTYCDTKYSYYDGEMMTVDKVVDIAVGLQSSYVCITGGEPLLQKDVLPLMKQLCDLGKKVSLETSGSKSIEEVDSRVKIILDVKTPDSGAENSFDFQNLKFTNSTCEFKFVICSEKDLEWSENFCRQHEIFEKFTVLYSPSYGKVDPKWLAEKILQKKSTARLQMQLHKYIWSPEARGV
jgi:7-carboxy-7-deazaguanine synthase